MTTAIETTDDVRVHRRFVPRMEYAKDVGGETYMGLYVDAETTGLDTATASIIELGLVPFRFDAQGNVYQVGAGLSFFEDPGHPIPEEVVALTGITDEMVQGQRIPDASVAMFADEAVLVIAHSAGFDRKMLERRFPVFVTKPWACSIADVPWKTTFGLACAKLECLAANACSVFFDAHRAIDDCRVGVHVLASATSEGRTALSYLLEAVKEPSFSVWAVGAPFDVKDSLKARGYRWGDEHAKYRKTWYREGVREAEVTTEREWLAANAFCHRPIVERVSRRDKYSIRA